MSHKPHTHHHEPETGLAALGWASLGLGLVVWAIVCEIRYQIARHRERRARPHLTAASARGSRGTRKI